MAERLAQPTAQAASSWSGCPAPSARPEALDQAGVTFDHVLSIEISDAEIEERMEGRRVCSTLRRTPTTFTPSPPNRRGYATAAAAY